MSKYEISNVKDLIRFVIPLFKEECDKFEIMSDFDSMNYFLYGGCKELANVINYFFPTSDFALKKDNSHIAISYNDVIYDAYDGMDEDELIRYGIPEDYYNKDSKDFEIFSKNDIDNNLTTDFGRNLIIQGKKVDEFIIYLLNNIPSIIIFDKNLSGDEYEKRVISYRYN